ncbi:MAG: TOBE domain-containing protein [Streptosporangiales bacterium]|nr:TOBE domain-containing protein [Streptosporangiales bacterium]
MLVLEDGKVAQDASPGDVTRAPRSAWVARLLGRNAYPGTADDGGIVLDDGFRLVTADPLPGNGPALAVIHPEDVALYRSRPEGSPRNTWPARVELVTPVGTRLRVATRGTGGGPDAVAEITPAAAADLTLAEGVPIWVTIKATEVTLTPL